MQLIEYIEKLTPQDEYLNSFDAPLKKVLDETRQVIAGLREFNAELSRLEGLRSVKKGKKNVN
jgi:hypothetical protein